MEYCGRMDLSLEDEDRTMELDVKIEAKDLYDYMLRHSYNSASGIIGSCFGAMLIVLAVMSGQWLYLIFGVIMLLYLPWTLFIRSRQQILSNPGFQKPLHYLLDEQGITISQGEETVQYPWEELVKAVSTGRSIIVYTSKVNATIFPKKQLAEKLPGVVEMISTHMPPAKVKIRN